MRPSTQVCSLRRTHESASCRACARMKLHSKAQARTSALPRMLGAGNQRTEESAAKLASQGLPPLQLHTACTQQVGLAQAGILADKLK